MNRFLAGLACLAVATAAKAQEPIAPIGPTLQFTVVSEVDVKEQTVSFCDFAMVPVIETRTRKVERNGRLQEEVYEIEKYVYQVDKWDVPLKDVRLSTAGGQRIDAADIPRRLTPGTAVLLFPNDQRLDKRYLALLKDDALIVTLPPEEDDAMESEPADSDIPRPAPRDFEPGPSVPDAPPVRREGQGGFG